MTGSAGQSRRSGTASRYPSSAAGFNRYRIASVAEQQWGVASWAQLRQRLSRAALTRAIGAGRLHQVFPKVWSPVPLSLLPAEGWHAAAVLCGGAGAGLAAHSAAWWAELVKQRPTAIHVAVRGRRVPVDGIVWHRLELDMTKLRRMPITPLARIPLDLAPSLSAWELRSVLAELQYRHGVETEEVRLHLGRGRSGAVRLRQALDAHTPQLAATKSELERAFARFLEDRGFELPSFNAHTGKATVDAIYVDQRIAIELDGLRGHSGERRILRDHRRDMHRRADGFIPLRYHFSQLKDPNDCVLIERELERFGVRRHSSTGREQLGPFGTG